MPGMLQLLGLQRRLGEAVAWHALATDAARPVLTPDAALPPRDRVAAAVSRRAELLRTAGTHPQPPVARPEGSFILTPSADGIAADYWLGYLPEENAILCWIPPSHPHRHEGRAADEWTDRLFPPPAGPLPVAPAVRNLEYEPPPTLVSKVERFAYRARLMRRVFWVVIVVVGLAASLWMALRFAFPPRPK